MHIAIGTPMYGGMCYSEFVVSITQLQHAMTENKHKLTCLFMSNESLVQRARNAIVHTFLNNTDASHLLFCDSDQGFTANDVALMIKEDKDIITGIVPMKDINWELIKKAVKKNKKNLIDYSGYFNTTFLKNKDRKKVFEIKYGGSGFMLIKRQVFEKMIPFTDYYLNGAVELNKQKVYNFFSVDNIKNELLSEDYSFCLKWKNLGGKIWAAPWAKIVHVGTYRFSGTFNNIDTLV